MTRDLVPILVYVLVKIIVPVMKDIMEQNASIMIVLEGSIWIVNHVQDLEFVHLQIPVFAKWVTKAQTAPYLTVLEFQDLIPQLVLNTEVVCRTIIVPVMKDTMA